MAGSTRGADARQNHRQGLTRGQEWMRWLIPRRVWRLTGRSGRARIVTGCLPPFPSREEVGPALADDGIVSAILERFDRLIGLWA